jgi:hypothetical protein
MYTAILSIARNMNYDFVNFITIPNPKIGEASFSLVKQSEDALRTVLTQHSIGNFRASSVTKSEQRWPALFLTYQLKVEATFNEFVSEAKSEGFTVRTAVAWAKPEGHLFALRHPEPQFARSTFELNWLAASTWKSDTATWIWRYVLCLWCHIFVDGNGRLARRFLASALYNIDLTNKVDFNLCLHLAEHIHADIKDQLVVMESQNRRCWLTGAFELLSQSISKRIMNSGF